MPATQPDDDSDSGAYSLAPDDAIGVSPAANCTATLDTEKRQAVKAYLNTLGPALREKYGAKQNYTPVQVRETAFEKGLSIDYVCWAYLIHCTPVDFNHIHVLAGEACDYSAMRSAVGSAFFSGNADFSAFDVTEAIVSGTAEAAVSGMGDAIGWLGDVDWSGLLDWS